MEKLVAESSSGDAPSIEQANSPHSQQKLAGEGKFALLQFVTLFPDTGIWSTRKFPPKEIVSQSKRNLMAKNDERYCRLCIPGP